MLKKLLFLGSGVVLAGVCFVALSTVANASDVAVSASVIATPVGIAGPISGAGQAPCPTFNRSLSFGVSGSDVSALQAYLDAQGYLNVSPTGYFGPLTQSAVAQWQAKGGVAILGSSGSGIFGPRSRAYYSSSCGSSGSSGSGGGTTQNSLTFSATPSSGIAPLTVQFVATAPQGTQIGNSINFGDGTSGTLAFVPVCSSCNAEATVSHTYTAIGTYNATLTSGSCACPANGICNCPAMIILGTATVNVTATGESSSTSSIQQLNSPGSVTLATGGIAEIRNANFYFTLASITASTATINITQVGCWNSFPSDPTPIVRCELAVVPTPPQSLSVGQTYDFGKYAITLTNMTSDTAEFSIQ